jgi:hypothetical protein
VKELGASNAGFLMHPSPSFISLNLEIPARCGDLDLGRRNCYFLWPVQI